MHFIPKQKKKVLFTTVPASSVSIVNQIPGRKIEINALNTVDDCILVANNESFQSGKIQPAIGLHFLKENIPSIDMLEYPTWAEYENALAKRYDIIAIGFYTVNYYDAVAMVLMARGYGVKEVWAGNYGALTPGVAGIFDRIITGCAEKELKLAIEGELLKSIKHPILTTPFRMLSHEESAGFLITKRGCKYKCKFCSTSYFSTGVDTIAIEEIERLLDVYREMGVKYIIIFDETFLQDRTHARKTIELLHKKNMKWFCTTRADLLTGHALELKRQGCDGVYIGIESMNNNNLVDQRKGEAINKVINTIEELHGTGISVSGTYILGLPHDTRESIMEDLERLSRLPVFVLIFLVYTPYPELPQYRTLQDNGFIINNDWRFYDGMNMVFRHPHMTTEQVRELFEYAVCNVYNPYNYNKRRVLQRMDRINRRTLIEAGASVRRACERITQ